MVTVKMSAAEVAEVLSLKGDDLSRYLERPDGLLRYEAAEAIKKRAGEVDGKHYTKHVPDVKALLKAGDLAAAEGLLLRLIDAIEAEGRLGGVHWTLPLWFHGRLASIYKKLKRPDEGGAIMARYKAQFVGKSCQPSID